MLYNSYFIIFLSFTFGFFLMALIYYIIIKRNKSNGDSKDIGLIKENIRSIQQELQSFNLAQIKIENSLVRGGSQQQGEWGEFVLINILENSGLRENHDFEIFRWIRLCGSYTYGSSLMITTKAHRY